LPNEYIAFGPGRVNLIGEHTDYNDGLALPFAISDGVTVTAQAIEPRRVEARARDLSDSSDRVELDRRPAKGRGWRSFLRGAVGELQDAGFTLAGARLEIEGSVARGAGLSSSAALEVALVLALLAVAGADAPDRIELAKLCSRVENDWVGARTGLLDQIASLCGRQDRALRVDFRTLTVDQVKLELHGHRLATLDSGEQHSNAAGGYNQRRAECAEAREALGLKSLRDATEEQARELPGPLDRRVRHIVTENARVEATVAALEDGDLKRVGQLLDESHASLRDWYEISTAAVERAVDRCKSAGAIGARIMGGGFGGNVLALYPPDARLPDGAVEVTPGPGAEARPR
jgi:galactokinase